MLGDRIKKIRSEKNITQKQVAEKLSIVQSTVAMWETNKREPDIETIKKIAAVLGVPVSEIIEEPQVEPNAQRLPEEYIHMIPVFESVSAGFGANAENVIVDVIPLFIRDNTEANRTICVRVHGDSMHPQIQDGDLVQVLKQETAETGDIVVILDGDNGYVKRYIHGKNGVVLESFNPSYPPMRFTREESNELRIVGIVRRIIRDI